MTFSATGTPANIEWWSIPFGKSQSMLEKTSTFTLGYAFCRSIRIPGRTGVWHEKRLGTPSMRIRQFEQDPAMQ